MILAADEGTTNAKALLFDGPSHVFDAARIGVAQEHPRPEWVEQRPEEIWDAQLRAMRAVLTPKVPLADVETIGIANQRETILLWDRKTGAPLYNAIVWQDRRAAAVVDRLGDGERALIHEKTGLVPDAYFSAPKIVWLLENVPKIRARAELGEVRCGTVDTYLVWKLTGGTVHATDYSNASRTMIFNIQKLEWDEELLELLKIPAGMLPEVRATCDDFGVAAARHLGRPIPITGVAGDQQAALFGQAAFEKGDTKCTLGTGGFVLMNTGTKVVPSTRLLSTIAWGVRRGGRKTRSVTYALEGSILATGSALDWALGSLGLAKSADEAAKTAASVPDAGGAFFVPALAGLGAPYWDPRARGLMIGFTHATTRAQILRAVFESTAYRCRDVVCAMSDDSGLVPRELRMDGGGSLSDFLLQFLADLLGIEVVRPTQRETTAAGAASFAGLGAGIWSIDDLRRERGPTEVFKPAPGSQEMESRYRSWTRAVVRSRDWAG